MNIDPETGVVTLNLYCSIEGCGYLENKELSKMTTNGIPDPNVTGFHFCDAHWSLIQQVVLNNNDKIMAMRIGNSIKKGILNDKGA